MRLGVRFGVISASSRSGRRTPLPFERARADWLEITEMKIRLGLVSRSEKRTCFRKNQATKIIESDESLTRVDIHSTFLNYILFKGEDIKLILFISIHAFFRFF